MTDERQNKPSASSMERLAACPGSWAMCQDVPRVENEDATRGTAIHAWLEQAFAQLMASTGAPEAVDLLDPHPLDSESHDTACKCLEQLDQYLTHTFGPVWGKDLKYETEVRRWHPMGFYSGKADLAIRFDSHHVVVDYKTGFEPVTAADNLQLRTLAVLESYHFADRVTCLIIQPTLRTEPLVVHYSAEDIARAEFEIANIVHASQFTKAPRRAGEHCKYCPAKTVCPEAMASLYTMEQPIKPVHLRDTTDKVLTGSDLARLLPICDQADEVISDIRSQARARLAADPNAIPGYRLAPGSVKHPIEDATIVYHRAMAAGVPHEQFMGAVKLTKEKFEWAVRVATKLKGKKLAAKLDELLDGCLGEKQDAPSLERVKE